MDRATRFVADAVRAGAGYLRHPKAGPDTTTVAGCDRAILELWDLGWDADEIAVELGIGTHLIEQAIAIFDGGQA